MEVLSCSVNFVKSGIRVSFPPFNFLLSLLIFTACITKSTSIHRDFSQVPYSRYCNGVVRESPFTETQLSRESFLRLDKAVYSLGNENPRFNFDPVSTQVASFSTREAYETKSKGIVKVNAVLNLVGPGIIDYFSGNTPRRRLRLVKFRPPRLLPRQNVGAGFRLFGFWDSDSGKLCMVGSGSVSTLTSVNVVFKLDYPNSSVLNTSLINGTLQSITPSGSATYFKPISIFGVSRMGYNYTYINKEINNDSFTLYDDMHNASLSLPDARGICSVITWGLRFELDYNNYDCNNVSCSFITVGDETFPRFMSIKVVDCFEDGKVRYIVQFSNSTYSKGMSFYPLTSLVSEGVWNMKKNRLELVACQLFDEMSTRDCSIRLAFSLPSTLSLQNRSSIIGRMWSTKQNNLGHVSIYSPANLHSRIKGASYEYTQQKKVTTLFSKTFKGNTKGKKETYPDEKSQNLRFDMLVKNKKGQMAYGYASPLYIGNQYYSSFSMIEGNQNSLSEYTNISYVISFTTRGEFEFGGKIAASKMVEISAEGVFNTKNGVICMIGCKHMPYEKFQKKRSLDCELLITINYAKHGEVHGSIKSTRSKPDPLYFEPVEFGSRSITTGQARESIWRMDLEITMVLISNTLACIFIAFQLFHVRKNPEILPEISIIMLTVLTSAHMIPLLLNFEAIFIKNRKQNVFLGTDQWLEVNEVLVRIITMVAFLLQSRLLQLTYCSRNTNENKTNLWVFDRKVLYITFPCYIFAFFAHLLQFHASKNVSFWGELESYFGLVLDTFLVPQIVFNLFCDTRNTVLAPSFYIGSTIVRLLPHVYDIYRSHTSLWFYDKIYANPGVDFYSTVWDVVVCFGGTICVLVIFVQQRFGGRSVLPKRVGERFMYQMVNVNTQEG